MDIFLREILIKEMHIPKLNKESLKSYKNSNWQSILIWYTSIEKSEKDEKEPRRIALVLFCILLSSLDTHNLTIFV